MNNPKKEGEDNPMSKEEMEGKKDEKKIGGDTGRYKLVKQIDILTQIPEIEEFFSKALEEVKQKHWNIIDQFLSLKSGTDAKEKVEVSSSLSKSKSYFFEVSRVEKRGADPGHTWNLEKCKLQADENIVNAIFSGFLKKLDDYEIAPAKIQTEIVKLPESSRAFQINFTKSSDTRVVGFVKEIEKEEEVREDDFVLQDNINLLKVNNGSLQMDTQEIYSRVVQVLQKYPNFTRYIYLYYLLSNRSQV
jgi:hypothetical protein